MQTLGWCLALVMLAAAAGAPAAEKEDLSVLEAGQGGEALRAHLLAECGKCFDARRRAVAAIEKPEQVAERQQKLREAWMAAVGPFPAKTPLAPRTVAALDRQGYRIEKVIYESRPNHHVTANLYLPKDARGPSPGVLIPSGHDRNAKACDAYQSLAILLARNGFVVLCYDPIGQGERIQTFKPDGQPATWGTGEHTLLDIGARLVGLCVAHYRLWDGIRSIDYLAGRPEVDPERLGCTGNSGGGTMTSYLMATDERIYAAAPSCYLTSLERLFPGQGPQDGEQNIPGQVALGIEHADYILLRAPKPTIMLTAAKDFFDINGSWETFREAKRLHGILGYGERLDLFEFPDEHGFTKPRREAALRWMRRWLQGIDEPAVELAQTPSTDADLQVTQSGHVVPELKGATVWDLNLARAKQLAPEREAFWRDRPKAECLAEVRRLAGVRPMAEKPAARSVGTLEREAGRIEKLVIERAGEVPVPALLFLPKEPKGRLPAVLYVDGRGKASDAAPGGPIEELVKAGSAVLSVDVRGFGETTTVLPKKYWHPEFPITHLALHLGRPLLGQRVEDVLAALECLAARPEIDAAKIGIVGVEGGALVALHAAALDERLREVTLRRSIASWMDVVTSQTAKNQFNQVVPGALARYDLPDLVRAIAPRPVRVLEPLDAAGNPVAIAKAP
jgi:cephalosporin-C deacetylase-like acetyl esterase